MKNIVELAEDRFEMEVMQATVPVVVDFYAPWCGPCKMLAPLLDQLAGGYEGRIKFVKLNVDEAPGVAGDYNVTGVPTLALVWRGKLVDRLVGLPPAKTLRAWLDRAATMAGQNAVITAA